MTPRPTIFISAVSRELHGARQLVANTLQFLGYEPLWQDIFGAQEGDLRGVLRKQIDASKGVVQLVGRRYGAEPPEPDAEFGRVSYTQYEALYARQRGKKVWYMLLDEHFPGEALEPEAPELQELQEAYRRRLKADTHLYHPLGSLEGLEADVLKLRDDLGRLRRGARRWSIGVAAMLAVILSLCVYMIWQQQHSGAQSRQMLLDTLPELVRQEMQGNLGEAGEKAVMAALAKKYGLDEKTLHDRLQVMAAQVRTAPTSTSLEKCNAAFVTGNLAEAERIALQMAQEAQTATPPKPADAVEALQIAASMAMGRHEYGDALAYLREAEKFTNRARDPLGWADVQRAIGVVLYAQGNYRAAAVVAREDVTERLKHAGSEDPMSLASRNNLAAALERLGQFAEAEKEYRAVLEVRERVLGSDNPSTLLSRHNLVVVLTDSGKIDEASKQNQRVLEAHQRLLGADDPLTLVDRHTVGALLETQEKYADAEKEMRAVVAARSRVLGAEDPSTLASRHVLAVVLYDLGRYDDAEKEHREVIAIQRRVLGPEHPETLKSRFCMAVVLDTAGKHAAAEEELRQVLVSRTRVLGATHPLTFETWEFLTLALWHEEKMSDMVQELTGLLAAQEEAYGTLDARNLASRQRLAVALFRMDKYAEAATNQEKALAIAQHATGEAAKGQLETACLALARYRLFARDFAGAVVAADMGLAIDPTDLLVLARKAHACLLLGKTAEAQAIYMTNRGKAIEGGAKRTWEQIILQDFEDLEKAGIKSAEFAGVRAQMKGN